MTSSIRKVLTDDGEYYAVFESVIDQFISPPSSLSECVEIVGDSDVVREFDLRSESLARIFSLLDKLEEGESLSVDEAAILSNFQKFLEATVAPQQYKYPEADSEVVNAWIEELGLRKEYPDYDWWEIVTDCAMYPAFQSPAFREQEKSSGVWLDDVPPATEAQNKLAGRYMKALAGIANLIGERPSTPRQVMEVGYQDYLTRRQGE